MENMMSLLILSPWGADIGFRLGGGDVVAVSGIKSLNSAISDALKSGKTGALAIPEMMQNMISPENRTLLSKQIFPMVVFYPLAEEWKASEVSDAEIDEMIYRAVGYRMRIKT